MPFLATAHPTDLPPPPSSALPPPSPTPSSSSRARPRLSPKDLNAASGTLPSSYFGAVPSTPAPADARRLSGGDFFSSGPPTSASPALPTAVPPTPSAHFFPSPKHPSPADMHPLSVFGAARTSPTPMSSSPAAVPPLPSHPGAFALKLSPSLRQAGDGLRGPVHHGGPQTLLGHPAPSSVFGMAALASVTAHPNPSSSSLPSFRGPPSTSFDFAIPPIRKMSAPVSRPLANARYTAFSAPDVVSLLCSPTSSILVLDLRTHSAWNHTRIASSVNICVPSTLLRRPTHTIDNVAAALSPHDLTLFSTWKTAGSIVVLDADSIALTETSGIAALLAKFVQAGYNGTLGWVRGGFAALKSECLAGGHGTLLAAGIVDKGVLTTSAPFSSPGKHGRPVLQVKDLPVSAFQLSSTSAFAHSGPSTSTAMLTSLGEAGPGSEKSSSSGRPGLGKRRKSGSEGFPLTLGMRGGVAKGVGPGLTTPAAEGASERRMATNPFFDNIRQNSEALSLERSLANLSPVEFPSVSAELIARLPPFLGRLLVLPPIERAHVLARQYYDLEVAERERLEGTLHWHANHQGKEGDEDTHEFQKYGISAGVELGTLNRFKNIFPYDHARVRLKSYLPGATDYVNASHIRLPASPRRFIASQGPLQTTYPDFWQMCDQENVGVIIMLTNLHEGGREKCSRYWIPQPTSGWDIEVEGGEEDDEGPRSFFSSAKGDGNEASTIRRQIHVRRRTDSPNKRRKIRHIQYRAWPDFDIPAQPSDVVALVREVEAAQQDYLAEIGWAGEEEPPILAHCSAGVGRTGVFIMVSTMLEKLVRERRAARAARGAPRPEPMDLDSLSSTQPSLPRTPSHSSTDSSVSPLPSPGSSTSDAVISAHVSRSTLNPTSPTTSSAPTSFQSSNPPTTPPESDLPLDDPEPILAGVNAMREQRMSMVATYRQYVCVLECVLVGILQELALEDELDAAETRRS